MADLNRTVNSYRRIRIMIDIVAEALTAPRHVVGAVTATVRISGLEDSYRGQEMSLQDCD